MADRPTDRKPEVDVQVATTLPVDWAAQAVKSALQSDPKIAKAVEVSWSAPDHADVKPSSFVEWGAVDILPGQQVEVTIYLTIVGRSLQDLVKSELQKRLKKALADAEKQEAAAAQEPAPIDAPAQPPPQDAPAPDAPPPVQDAPPPPRPRRKKRPNPDTPPGDAPPPGGDPSAPPDVISGASPPAQEEGADAPPSPLPEPAAAPEDTTDTPPAAADVPPPSGDAPPPPGDAAPVTRLSDIHNQIDNLSKFPELDQAMSQPLPAPLPVPPVAPEQQEWLLPDGSTASYDASAAPVTLPGAIRVRWTQAGWVRYDNPAVNLTAYQQQPRRPPSPLRHGARPQAVPPVAPPAAAAPAPSASGPSTGAVVALVGFAAVAAIGAGFAIWHGAR
jgi:hypothetical protein